MLWLSMVRLLVKARQGYEEGVFARVIDTQTTFCIHNGDSDKTVKASAAKASVSGFATGYRAAITAQDYPAAGHTPVAMVAARLSG